MKSKRAIFLDRDGVINQTVFKMGKPRAPYTPEEFKFFDGVEDAVKELRELGFTLIVVTNQPDVARGWVSREAVDHVNDVVFKTLKVDEIVCCFHTEKDSCLCRKPLPGMLVDAAKKHGVSLSESFMVGDRYSDVAAGAAAGCKTILIGEGDERGLFPLADHTSTSLREAVSWIRAQRS